MDAQRAAHDKQMQDMMAAHTANMNKLTQQSQANTNAAVAALNQRGQAPQQAAGQVQETKTCPNCGKEIRAGAKFCTKCGAKQ